MAIQRIAMLSVHTSPIAALGGKKTGGMNVYVRDLARELGQRGIKVDIYTRRSEPGLPDVDHSIGDNVRVIHLFAGPVAPLDPDEVYEHLQQFTAGLIAFTTRQNIQYDLIYSHYWLSGWVANKLKEVWNTPFVQMFHTLGHMKQRIGTGEVTLPTTRITVETQVMQWADALVAATPAEQSQLLWLYRADRRKIVVIPPGVNPEKFRPMPQADARRELGIEGVCRLMLFVGRIEPLKAVDTILQALHMLREQRGDLVEKLCFAIIGGDPADRTDQEMTRLLAMQESLELGDVVDFLGAKDHALLPYYYAAADAVVMPSDYESFGMVALEAMASGTPVIASKVGGLAFLVRDEETGYLIPVRDPAALAGGIETILAQPEKREHLSRNAAALAEEYAWANIADRLLAIFEPVANRRKNWVYPLP